MESQKEQLKDKERIKNIKVVQGDITQISADALITAINSGGLWFGGIDEAIQKVAGNMYHHQAAQYTLKNLQTIVARGTKEHSGKFKDVVFVVDDLESPLNKIIYAGLERANNEGYQNILLPAIRMGVMAGTIEKTPQEATEEIALGLKNFLGKYSKKTKLEDIKFVVYNNSNLARDMSSVFDKI